MTWLSSQIYSDLKGWMANAYEIFTTQMLPAIWEWLTVTKEYVMELFWRYIQYAIAMDIMLIVLYIGLCIMWIVLMLKFWKKGVASRDDSSGWYPIAVIGCLPVSIIFFVLTFIRAQHLIQSIFIPELTIYEKIVDMKHDYECSKEPNAYGCP